VDEYTLYLDESTTKDNMGKNPYFCMAGIIINNNDFFKMEESLNNFKKDIWADLPNQENIILHQKCIIDASRGRLDKTKFPEYDRFRSKKTRSDFYNKFKNIFTLNNIVIVGGSINLNNLNSFFDIDSINKTDQYLIALQLLLENYCHFLCTNHSKGKIIYESRQLIADEKLRDRFYHIKLMGSMYITKEAMSKYLLGIDFVKKENNNAGLQIADFVPNSFARRHAGFNQIDKSFSNTLRYYRYGTKYNDQDRFGVKNMP
jgi:hypothetical protein